MTRAQVTGQRAEVRNELTLANRFSSRLAAVIVLSTALVAGCRQDMHDAPRYDPLEESALAPSAASARPLVEGTVARGHLNDDELLTIGKTAGAFSRTYPFAITSTDLDRGQERFNIYCAPCHGRTGDGNGMVVQRGYRQAASLHVDRLREVEAGYIFDVASNGFGAMPSYRAQISADDRWRVVAYIRALQLSQHAAQADVPADDLGRLMRGEPAPAAAPAAESGEHR
jgi:mono/diheme cytochrome c family protein